jgi:hypothetical protein
MVGDNESRIPRAVLPRILLGGLYYMFVMVVMMEVVMMMDVLLIRSFV